MRSDQRCDEGRRCDSSLGGGCGWRWRGKWHVCVCGGSKGRRLEDMSEAERGRTEAGTEGREPSVADWIEEKEGGERRERDGRGESEGKGERGQGEGRDSEGRGNGEGREREGRGKRKGREREGRERKDRKGNERVWERRGKGRGEQRDGKRGKGKRGGGGGKGEGWQGLKRREMKGGGRWRSGYRRRYLRKGRGDGDPMEAWVRVAGV